MGFYQLSVFQRYPKLSLRYTFPLLFRFEKVELTLKVFEIVVNIMIAITLFDAIIHNFIFTLPELIFVAPTLQ